MWRLCALCALFAAPTRARSFVCDNGQTNIHLDLPNKDVYSCLGGHIPLSSQVYPNIATKHKEEETYGACMNLEINHTAPIPNSGAHRPIGAKYGEYLYCPPQRWVNNLQHAGVAFLYHPCVDPQLKEAFSFVARSCVSRHIITPLPSLTRERPIALATWCSTLEMSYMNVTEIRLWLKEHVPHQSQQKTEEDGAYQHLLIRPSLVSADRADLCHDREFQMLNHFRNHRRLSVWRLRKRRRAVLLPTPVGQGMASSHVSASSTLAGQHIDTTTEKHIAVTQPAGTGVLSLPTMSSSSVNLKQDSHTQSIKADIHSRETEENNKDTAQLPVQNILPTTGNQSLVLPDSNVTQPIVSNVTQQTIIGQSSQPGVTHKDHAGSLQEDLLKIVPRPVTTQQSQHPLTEAKASPTTAEKKTSDGRKQECHCQQDTPVESSAKAQKRLGNGQHKSSEGFVSTPQTQEATWAAASLIFLFSLLTFSILYTQIYKKFRKSQSLYWTSESHSEEKETVASIVKRRLVQGHSRRKKWFGRKKSPKVLYENLSESSD